jgi:type VI secretion system protein ImpL
MKRLLGILTAKWFVTLLGAILLSLLVWFIGPLIAVAEVRPLDSQIVRLLVVMGIIFVWGLINIFSRVKQARTNDQMAAALTQAKDPVAAEADAEIAVLRKRLEESLAELKRSAAGKGRTRYLYQLPWYMLIGPPGSGKTTALQNSGLNFPLAAKFGKDPVKGVGGTRHCDWWLTDEAVLLDTAGRYTTQDSHGATDQAGWKGFLGLLKKFRPRQPINGALVAISIADIVGLSSPERLAHAHAIRLRLRELGDEFGIRFPVYVLLTKADLLAGFVEYFDDLGREDREQVWGMTLAFDKGSEKEPPSITGFGTGFDALVQRLNERLLGRIQQETDLQKRALIYGFPAQVASLKDQLREFLDEIFMPNRYEGRPLLRGVYFTSGTQEGTPVDRIMAGIAQTFGLDRQRLPAFSGSGRGYFLNKLLRSVVFAEASVAGADAGLERRQTLLRRGAYAAAAIVFFAALTAWTVSYIGNDGLIADVDSQVAQYTGAVAPVATRQVVDADLMPVLPPLRMLRAMPGGYDARAQTVPWSLTFGLYQGDKLGSQEVLAYHRALNNIFLPRLLIRLGTQIRAKLDDPNYVHEALKTYLMLGGAEPPDAGPPDKDFIRAWMDLNWQLDFPGDDQAGLRAELRSDLDALLEEPLQPIGLDGGVIESARQALLKSPLASRAYNTIKDSAAARGLELWRISRHAGPGADRVFSGKLLSDGIPGLYTHDGYYKVFLPALAHVAQDTVSESWVLGDAPSKGTEIAVTADLQRDIAQLYTSDYKAQWDKLIADIAIVPFHGFQDAAQVVGLLSDQNSSPLKLLLIAIAKETQLAHPPDLGLGAAGSKLAAAAGAAATAATTAESRLSAVIGQPTIPTITNYGQPVEDHFKDLQNYALGMPGANGAPPGPAPLDDLIRSLNDVYAQLNTMGQPGSNLLTRPGNGAIQQLAVNAQHLPPAVAVIVAGIARNSSTTSVGGTREQIKADWQAKVLPTCKNFLDQRYPLFKDSKVDADLADFTTIFAPNGLIDSFFKTSLQPFVDQSHLPWRWQTVDGVDLGLSQDVLLQFQIAASIRDGFFSGASAPSLKFQMTPVSLDADSAQIRIDIDGQEVLYAQGPLRSTQLQWPGTPGSDGGRVTFTSPSGQISTMTQDSGTGPWALFRLFDEGQLQTTGLADRMKVTFSAGGHTAVFEVAANSVNNPLTMKALHQFRCPAQL